MQQACRLCHVADVGDGADDRMHQTRFGIHTDMRLHSKMPLVALLGLVHVGVTLAVLVLGRTGCRNDGGIHNGAGLKHQALLGKRGVDGGSHLGRQSALI